MRDIVGLYLSPPDKALVVRVMPQASFQHGEKSQIQALDRTQPMLPMRRGEVEPKDEAHPRLVR